MNIRDVLGRFAGGTRSVWSSGYVWIKTETGWEEEHRVVWKQHNGPIPRGHIVHHKDDNKLNNDIGNLRLLTRAEHQRHHRLGTGIVRVCSDCPTVITTGSTGRCKSCAGFARWAERKARIRCI